MSALLRITSREVRTHWLRNTVQGVILLGAVLTQLLTTLSVEVSHTAVVDYGATVYGYGQTWMMETPDTVSRARITALDTLLDTYSQQVPGLDAVVVAHLAVDLLPGAGGEDDGTRSTTLLAVHGPWHLISATMATSSTYDEVVAEPTGLKVLVAPDRAATTGLDGAGTVTLVADDTGGVLHQVPAYVGPDETNTALDYEVLGTHRLLRDLGVTSTGVQVYWRCTTATCARALDAVTTALTDVGAGTGAAQRVDQVRTLAPVLAQQRTQGTQFSAIVLALGALAVAVVAVAFVETRAPEFVTLRTLGMTRLQVCLLALLEGLVVAATVGLVAVAVGLGVTQVDPDLLNSIGTVHVDAVAVPWATLARTLVLTLGIGLLTSLLPAVRAYRAVRSS